MKVTIWTQAHDPFRMGGNVYYAVKTEVDGEGPFDIGCGMSAYVVTAPNGRTFIAESETGAIVGDTLEDVRRDVTDADPAIISKQMQAARVAIAAAETASAEEFWRKMRCLAQRAD